MRFVALAGVLVGVLVVAACSSKSRPPEQQVVAAIQKEVPNFLEVAGKQVQFSPIKEIAGTTLPEGSYQVDVQVSIRARETLYIQTSAIQGEADPRLSPALRAELKPLVELDKRGLDASWAPGISRLPPFLLPLTEAGGAEVVWVKVIAEPRGTEWKLTVVEGNPQGVFSGAKPKSSFPADVFVYESEAHRRQVADVAAELQKGDDRAHALAALRPKVLELRKQETELAERYGNEARQKEASLVAKMRALFHSHDERLSAIRSQGGKMRDKLTQEEVTAFDRENEPLKLQYKEAESLESSSRARAKAEIDAKIRELNPAYGDALLSGNY